jgi:hypothetical protein
VKKWFDVIECPDCGSADIDLAEEVPGPLFRCQECGEPFDPPISKPTVQLVGTDGNAYSVIGTVKRALIADGQSERATEWVQQALRCPSYDALLQLVFDYVDPL